LRLYQDEQLSLFHLYSLQEGLQKALRKQVWLKSGAYLVIEPTEALTVIDVNTGKYTGKKTAKETIRAINLEAAERIGEELRLRNLSGIVLVDFIDTTDDTANEELLLAMRRIVAADPVKTTVVDMTALHLMELTRKKISRPLHEQAALLFQKSSTFKSSEEKAKSEGRK
ncbi:MAG: ribonuclease E/G, partial [bacterium]|nr:ribonuclease E/G [bacterium]